MPHSISNSATSSPPSPPPQPLHIRLPEFISSPPSHILRLPEFVSAATTPQPPSPPPPPPPLHHRLPDFISSSATTSLPSPSPLNHRLSDFMSDDFTQIPPSPPPRQLDHDPEATEAIDFATVELDDDFFRIFQLITEDGREESPPPSPPSPPSENGFGYDYLRLDLGGWEIDEDTGVVQESGVENSSNLGGGNEVEGENREGGQRRRRPFGLRPVIENNSRRRRRAALGLDDLGARVRRHRVVRWADYFAGSEEHSIEVRLQLAEGDAYFGNPGDYVDAAGYEAFLRVLAERDNGGKGVVMGLESVVVGKEEGEAMVCAVCRDSVNVGELVKKLPCRHKYHGDCIVQWLKLRNSCPVCRFELPTDDPEYEIERKKKLDRRTDVVVDGGTSTANAGDAGGGGSGSSVVSSSYDSID
ncbi:hypothetical protein Leryth_006154 [Lithospermum erythrorhizon]|nr:hypothetical protein Leryth_006154 [Lithospermum erythrorhizon]